ncbi:unnamed protein product [Polarella glacialis]|uniref:Uncharacterized protein n=1 Tax=Polarella glacialis TaxID=89957 RepID=A0A813K501_POLGL|nr:unnamed protein product [Polarella glacialis]CAE8691575.1 unnamed protein product [Polarella glacialis]
MALRKSSSVVAAYKKGLPAIASAVSAGTSTAQQFRGIRMLPRCFFPLATFCVMLCCCGIWHCSLHQDSDFGGSYESHFFLHSRTRLPEAKVERSRQEMGFTPKSQTLRPSKPTRIPKQLVLTAKAGSMDRMPPLVKANVMKTLTLNPQFTVRWLGDKDCRAYLWANFSETQLPVFFDQEQRGSYRSDICRAAVLAHEGGFYTDIDVEMKLPFEDLVDNATTFVSAYCEDRAVLNALIGAVPGSAVMKEVLQQIMLWYQGQGPDEEQDGTTSEWMGPVTTLRALRAVGMRDCLGQDMSPFGELQFPRGDEVLRMLWERPINCYPVPGEDCSPGREASDFPGVQFGIYLPVDPHTLVAWPRFEGCKEWGCGTGGWDEEMPPKASMLSWMAGQLAS